MAVEGALGDVLSGTLTMGIVWFFVWRVEKLKSKVALLSCFQLLNHACRMSPYDYCTLDTPSIYSRTPLSLRHLQYIPRSYHQIEYAKEKRSMYGEKTHPIGYESTQSIDL